MRPRWRWATLFILSSLLVSVAVWSEENLDRLLTSLKSGDPLTREIAQRKIGALGTNLAPRIARELLRTEDRETQARLERAFRKLVLPLVQAWRSAVTPVPGGGRAGQDLRVVRVENQLRALGVSVWPSFHRLRLCSPISVSSRAERYLEEDLKRTKFPADPVRFRRERYFLSPGLLLRKDPEARTLLEEHLKLTLRDFVSGEGMVRERAQEELCFLGEVAAAFLKKVKPDEYPGLTRAELEALSDSVSWCVWPELRARTGLDMTEWDNLSWREKARLVSLWKRVAGEDAIPVLRRIRTRAREEVVRERAEWELWGLDAIRGPLPNRLPATANRILIVLARQLRDRGEIEKALELLWQVVEKLPLDREARYQLAFTLQVAKRYDEAVKQYLKTLAMKGGDKTLESLAWYNLACAYALKGESEKAIEALLKAIECGFRDREHIEVNDPDLESIRKLPAFKKVLEALDKAVGK